MEKEPILCKTDAALMSLLGGWAASYEGPYHTQPNDYSFHNQPIYSLRLIKSLKGKG